MIEFFTALVIAFGFIFVMELGDKTQLIILTLATKKHSPRMLAFGAVVGFAVIVFFGGIIALLISNFIPLDWITLGSSIAFLVLGGYQLIQWFRENAHRKDDVEDIENIEESGQKYEKTKYSFLAGMLAIITMELGDKTQVATILLASTSASFIGTLIGSWLALCSLAIIGAFAGKWISKKIPKKWMDMVAALLFIIIGIIIIISII